MSLSAHNQYRLYHYGTVLVMHIEGFFFFFFLREWSSGDISLILFSANVRNLNDSIGYVSSRGVWRWKKVK